MYLCYVSISIATITGGFLTVAAIKKNATKINKSENPAKKPRKSLLSSKAEKKSAKGHATSLPEKVDRNW